MTCVYSERAGDYTRIVHPGRDYTPPAASQAWIRRVKHHRKRTPGSTDLLGGRWREGVELTPAAMQLYQIVDDVSDSEKKKHLISMNKIVKIIYKYVQHVF